MDNKMIFKVVVRDMQPIDKQRIQLFIDSDHDERSVSTFSEAEVTRWLLNDRDFRRMFLENFFPGESEILDYHEVITPFFSKGSGDIDLILVKKMHPGQAIAFQVKTVKAITASKDISHVNRADKIRNGVIQANKYQSLGFYKSYLLIIVLEDSRHVKDSNSIIFRYGKSDSVERVFRMPWEGGILHNDIGIVFVHINQLTGRTIDKTVMLGLCEDRRAAILEQSKEVTKKIEELISKPSLTKFK